MSWPLSQDYNEAIQNPQHSLGDPLLKRGEPVVNDMGLPIPRSGNFADVYQFKDANGKTWALKCFTRKVTGLQDRYTAIDKHLQEAKLPFTVGFKYLAEGIRIRKEWYPILQMEWVEGFTLNDFVRQHAAKTAYLEALFLMWVRLSKRLRQGDVGHGDLQHGNVLLVPGARPSTLELKLIDYDGMWVPSLAKKPPGETGHPAFQHPSRRDGAYDCNVDRFPHVLVACALRALIVGGANLWKRFDNGDNLLFREEDIRNPAASQLVRTLWEMNDPITTPLLGHLVLSTRQPMSETPWLDHLMVSEEVLALTPIQRRSVEQLLGAAETIQTAPRPVTAAPVSTKEVFAALSGPADDIGPSRAVISMYWLIPMAVLALGLLFLIVPLSVVLAMRLMKPADSPALVEQPPKTETQPPPVTTPQTPQPKPPENMGGTVEPPPMPPMPMPPKPVVKLTQLWSTSGMAAPQCLDFTRDGNQLVTSPGNSRNLIVFDVKNGKAQEPVPATVGNVVALTAAGPDQAIVTGADNTTALYNYAMRELVLNLQVKDGTPTPFALMPDGKDALCAGSASDTPRWRVLSFGIDTGQENRNWADEKSGENVESVRVSPDGSRWIAVDSASNIVVRELKAEKQVTMTDASKTAKTALLSWSNKFCLSFGKGNEIRLWDVANRRVSQVLPGHPNGTSDAIFSPDERWAISVGNDKKLRIWSIESCKEVQSIDLPEAASNVRWSPRGNFIATASAKGDKAAVQLWKIEVE